MTRRLALALIGLIAGQSVRAHAGLPKGWLRVDLGQWTGIVVQFEGQEYAIEPRDIWAALNEWGATRG